MRMLERSETEWLQSALMGSYDLRVGISSRVTADGYEVDIIPRDLHPNEGFTVRTNIGWRSIEAEFIPGPYSGNLIRHMSVEQVDGADCFRVIAQAVADNGARLAMFVNGHEVSPTDASAWPKEWYSLALSLRKSPVIPHKDSPAEDVLLWGGKLFALIICLLPLEESSELPPFLVGDPEGGVTRVEVNRYERSARNRAACIAVHGTSCATCSFNFGKRYGPLGEGFIHVHHVIPVSQIGTDYVIDPGEDLIPVCPNCHAMLHRRNPPLVPSELRHIVRTLRETQSAESKTSG